jgi:beta-mannosidase
MQYYARRFYAPVLVSPHSEEGAVKVYVVSDRTEAKPGTLRVRLMDFDGKVLLEETKEVRVEALASKVYLDWPLKKLADAGAADTARVFVAADLVEDGAEVSRNLIYLAPKKEIRLKPATLKVVTRAEDGKTVVRVSSPVLARSVYLSFGSLDVQPSDNYFDLLPGETVPIALDTRASLEEIRAQMKVVSLTDALATPETGAVAGASR